VSGETLDAYLRAHVTGPLGMDDTGYVAAPAQRFGGHRLRIVTLACNAHLPLLIVNAFPRGVRARLSEMIARQGYQQVGGARSFA
jgi:CubicO group peptidase (beta-lactamase class C family)